jgi:16S rRNA U516 pseudouridylate synthase RsuA-like enzyme
MASGLHEFATSELHLFEILDHCTFATLRLHRFKIPDLRTFVTLRLRRFKILDLRTFATLRLRRFKIPDLREFCVPENSLHEFHNLDVSRVTGFPEFPNNTLTRVSLANITLRDIDHPSQHKMQTSNLKRTKARKLKCGN